MILDLAFDLVVVSFLMSFKIFSGLYFGFRKVYKG